MIRFIEMNALDYRFMSIINSRVIWTFLGTAIALLSSIVANYLLLSKPLDSPISDEGAIHSIAVGFEYTEFFKQKPRKKIVAQTLVIKPRPLLFFNVKGVMEAMLINAQTDLYFSDASSSQMGLFPFTEQQVATDKQVTPSGGVKKLLEPYGPITRFVIEGLVLKIHNNTNLRLVVNAKRAIQQGTDSPWLLEGTVLWHPKAGKRIYSDQVFWYEQDQIFSLPRRYLLLTADGHRQEQKPVRLNLDLEPLSP